MKIMRLFDWGKGSLYSSIRSGDLYNGMMWLPHKRVDSESIRLRLVTMPLSTRVLDLLGGVDLNKGSTTKTATILCGQHSLRA